MAPRRACLLPLIALAALAASLAPVWAQDATPATQLGDWLKSSQNPQAAPGESYHATTGTVATDPFAVLSTGVLWQDTYGEVYTRQLGDAFSLNCQSTNVVLDEDAQELSRAEQTGFQFAPAPELTLDGNFHGATVDSMIPDDISSTMGGAFSAQSHLPWDSIISVGLQFDRAMCDAPNAPASQTNTYNAQIRQPLGKLPLSAVFKGSYDGRSVDDGPATSLPSLEQSLIWKPMTNTTVQMGLRQQQYQEYPGVDHELNEAIFADWSQRMLDNVSWHSYAEVLNSKGLIDQAPAASIASGANGTPQANNPVNNTSPTSSLPLSLEDQTVTFSTGPSVQLQKDLSASFEYSNRWDKNPAPGATGQEQRVSVSLKGTF